MSDTESSATDFPAQMRLAADIIDDVNTRLGGPINGHWRPSELRGEADQVEAEERDAAARIDQIDCLARELAVARFDGAAYDNLHGDEQRECNVLAARLIESGWRKGDAS